MTTSEFPCTEFACLVDYNAMTEDFILREDAEGIINFCMEHKDAVIMCCLDADRIPSIPVDDNIPDDSYWYNFLFNKETDTEVDFYNHHAEFNYYPFKIVSSMSTPIGLLETEEETGTLIPNDYDTYREWLVMDVYQYDGYKMRIVNLDFTKDAFAFTAQLNKEGYFPAESIEAYQYAVLCQEDYEYGG